MKRKLYIKKLERKRNKDKASILHTLRFYQERIDEEKTLNENSKAYLLEAEEYKGEFPDIKTIKYLICEFDTYSCGLGKSFNTD